MIETLAEASVRKLAARHFLPFATLALLAVSFGFHANLARAADRCPASVVWVESYNPAGPFSTAAPVFDSTIVDVWSTRITFDRTRGQLALTAASGGRLNALVRVVERFDLEGALPGTELDASLELQLDGSVDQSCGGAGCGFYVAGSIANESDSVTFVPLTQTHTAHVDLHQRLILPIHIVAGQPFTAAFLLEFRTGPGGGATAQLVGQYDVAGLPGGVRAIACPGADLTPVRHSTWGELKALYR
jgi:hypothetical protein